MEIGIILYGSLAFICLVLGSILAYAFKLEQKRQKELNKLSNPKPDESKNLHPVFNKNVSRGKDGRFISKKELV
jgi:hypothetical protein|tara:strand:- start:290 stop:511 length:222 start_codon:yes stop_codon:yes gene_type:complete